MIASRKKRQKCLECANCDGFACLPLDVWLGGKIKVSGREGKGKSNYIPVEVYGKRYCRRYRRRTAKIGTTYKDFPYSIDDGGKLKATRNQVP